MLFRTVDGRFEFTDAQGAVRTGDRKIEPALVVREGTLFAPGDITVAMRELYDADRVVFGRS